MAKVTHYLNHRSQQVAQTHTLSNCLYNLIAAVILTQRWPCEVQIVDKMCSFHLLIWPSGTMINSEDDNTLKYA